MEEVEEENPDSSLSRLPGSPFPHTRPNSLVVKKVCRREFIPAHIVAEAMSILHGLGLRWSGPITPSERQYVEQYMLAKHPQYSHGLIGENDLDSIYCRVGERRQSPFGSRECSTSPSPSLDRTQLEPSRLLDLLTNKSSPGNFVSVPEIQARNRVLQHCGLTDEDYFALFKPTNKDAMMLVGESYPFCRYKYYMTVIEEEADCIREFATYKESKVIPAPADWLDLRIKGSQLSQYIRRKSKHSPKGLFAYPAEALGTRHSMHWISEAHRNRWHVLLDATAIAVGRDRLTLALHRPDFVLCAIENSLAAPPTDITCLLVRKKAFDSTA